MGEARVFTLRLMLALMIAAPLAAAQPATPTKDEQPAAPAPNAESSEPFQVDGFRSAHWGMTDAQVKAAIRKDFNVPPEKVQTEENASERTAVLTITAGDLLEGAGKARVSYIFGYTGKKLIQVNISGARRSTRRPSPTGSSPPPISCARCFSATPISRTRSPATSRPPTARSLYFRAKMPRNT
jgi:hypothetical protein